ncbi:MAG: DUF6788 family protein [Actinomycetota bacterium]
MKRRLSEEALQARLEKIREDYARIKARVRDVGFICEGSVVERWMPCGKANCRCATDPDYRHGPYHQLSWKEEGKTVSRRLSPEHARLYQEWVANRRKLEVLVKQMKAVSRKAGRYLLDAAESPADPDRPRAQRRSGKRQPT